MVRWVVRVLAVAAIATGLVFFYLHPSARFPFQEESSPYQVIMVTTVCVSPFNRWTGHEPPPAMVGGPFIQEDEASGIKACDTAITGREHVGWTFIVLGIVGGGLTFLRRRGALAGQVSR